MNWETVIGLEIHVQLATDSKIFSGSSTAFGAAPNTQANAIDLALPGTLPVLNEQALHYAILFGLAVDADITRESVFERKNYFYPDLPKGYQTTQLDKPIVGAGQVEIPLDDGSSRTVRIHHAHLEEDAGKSLHEDFDGCTGIDLNRAGTPLIEIVTEPDMRSADEAVAFLRHIHGIVTYLGICDGDMSQGSLRCDANVSVRPAGSDTLGTRAELKNINSFNFVRRAILGEAQRQIELIEDGGKVVQQTRLYDADRDETRPMRSKEEANDYRYFPCPDLLPVRVDDALIDQLRSTMPELPRQKLKRFVDSLGLPEKQASQLVENRQTADYFEAVCGHSGDPRLSANWMTGKFAEALNEHELRADQAPMTPEQLALLIKRVADGTVNSKTAKQVFDALWSGDATDADAYIAQQGLAQMSDSGELEALVDEVLAANADQVEQYRNADEKKRKRMMGAFVGPIMKATAGKANPAEINKLLKAKLPD